MWSKIPSFGLGKVHFSVPPSGEEDTATDDALPSGTVPSQNSCDFLNSSSFISHTITPFTSPAILLFHNYDDFFAEDYQYHIHVVRMKMLINPTII